MNEFIFFINKVLIAGLGARVASMRSAPSA